MCFDREIAKLEGRQPNSVASAANPAASASLEASRPAAPRSAEASRPVPPVAIQSRAESPGAATSLPAESLTAEQAFGLSGDQIRKLEAHRQGVTLPPKAKNLSAQVSSVSHTSTGRWVLTLDNGQVWRQAETRPDFEVAPGVAVKISTGAMGSFWLETSKHNWTRVERVM
jgi:hypothetical protein